MHNDRFSLVKKFIVYTKRNIPTKAKILDIGPGSGIYLPFLKNTSYEIFASDIERSYLQNINIPSIKIIEDNIENTKFTSNKFHLIL